QFIGFNRRYDERLFTIDVRPGLQRGERNGMMLVRFPHRDAHEIRSFLFQHFAIVRIAAGCADFCSRSRETLSIRICQSRNLYDLMIAEDLFKCVTVIATSRVTNDGSLEFCVGFSRQRWKVSDDENAGERS